jgi:hypothetical protein
MRVWVAARSASTTSARGQLLAASRYRVRRLLCPVGGWHGSMLLSIGSRAGAFGRTDGRSRIDITARR